MFTLSLLKKGPKDNGKEEVVLSSGLHMYSWSTLYDNGSFLVKTSTCMLFSKLWVKLALQHMQEYFGIWKNNVLLSIVGRLQDVIYHYSVHCLHDPNLDFKIPILKCLYEHYF